MVNERCRGTTFVSLAVLVKPANLEDYHKRARGTLKRIHSETSFTF
jgi:hypothetical protein